MAKYLDNNGLLYLWSKIKAAFVAKEAGKGLSTNDLTAGLKTNYDTAYSHSQATHAPTNAEQNVQSDWNEADSGSDAYIKNKPTIPSGVIVDSALSDSSENAVQNKVIKGAIDAKISSSAKGQANGVASLDADGLVPSSQLPSFVDDVVEFVGIVATAPATCTTGDKYFNTTTSLIHTATATNTWGAGVSPLASKIYVDLSNNYSYRWGGSVMVLITSSDMVAVTNAEIDIVVAS